MNDAGSFRQNDQSWTQWYSNSESYLFHHFKCLVPLFDNKTQLLTLLKSLRILCTPCSPCNDAVYVSTLATAVHAFIECHVDSFPSPVQVQFLRGRRSNPSNSKATSRVTYHSPEKEVKVRHHYLCLHKHGTPKQPQL